MSGKPLRRLFLRMPWKAAMAQAYWKLYRLLLGNDVFVSYGRGDGTRYPEALVRRLTRRGLVCYYDRLGSPPGEKVSSKVLAQAKRSTLLVVITGPAAAKSENVLKEISEFDPLGRSAFVIPIDFEGALQGAIWRDLVGGISEEREPLSALEKGAVSKEVIRRISGIEDFVSRDWRLRRVYAWGIAAFAAVVFAVMLFSSDRIKEIEELREAAEFELKWASMRVKLESSLAKEARREREAALNDAEAALREASLAREETARQQEIAMGYSWANQAEMRRNQGLDSLRGSVALAIKSMARFFRLGVADLQADRTLRKGAGLLRPFNELPSPFRLGPKAMALSPDGKYIAICAEDLSSFPPPPDTVLVEVWSLAGKPHKTGSLPDLTPGCQDLGFHQGRLIVIGSENSVWSCEAWDRPSPKCRKFYDLDDDLASLRSGDGQILSMSLPTQVIQFWDLAGSPEPRSRLALGHLQGGVDASLLSLENDLLAIALFDSSPDTYTETVHVLDAKSGEEQMRFLAKEGSSDRTVSALAFGAGGHLLAASLADEDLEESEVIVWDLRNEGELARFPLPDTVEALAFSPDGLLLATGSRRGTRIWDLDSRTEIARLQGGGIGLTFSADGRWLAAMGMFKRGALIWDLERSLLEVPPLAFGYAREMILSQNGRYFAAGSTSSAQIWELASATQIDELVASSEWPEALTESVKLMFSPSGKYLVGGFPDSQGWLLEVGTGRASDLPPLLGASFDQDERFLALFGESGIEIRRAGEDRALISVPVKRPVLRAGMSPRSRYLAFAGSSPLLEIWSLDMKHERASRIEQLPLDGKLLYVAWSADERYLAASYERGFLVLRNTGSQQVVATLPSRVLEFGFTAKGERLVAVRRDGTLWVCELRGTCIPWTATCSSVPMHLALHPGGRYAAVALGDETTEVWDLLLRRRVAHFENGARLEDLAFSGDGRLLAGISALDGSVQQWLWHPEDLIHEAALRLWPSSAISPEVRARPSPAKWEE